MAFSISGVTSSSSAALNANNDESMHRVSSTHIHTSRIQRSVKVSSVDVNPDLRQMRAGPQVVMSPELSQYAVCRITSISDSPKKHSRRNSTMWGIAMISEHMRSLLYTTIDLG